MKLKEYIKLVIMALAIMFLSIENVISVESSNCAITGGHTIVTSYGSGTMTDYYNAIASSGGSTGASPLGFDKATAGGTGYYRVYNAFDNGGWYPINKSIDFSIDGCYNFYLDSIGHTTSTDYNQYEKGETAHIDIEFNSTNFNTVNYTYYFYLIDPDNTYKFFDEEINAPIFSVDTVLNKVGVYRIQVRITNKTDVLTSLYTNEVSIISTDGTSISFIDFDKSSYTLGETATISWGISSNFWSNFGFRYIEIWQDGTKIDELNSLPYFGTRSYKFPEIGQYEAQLWEYSLSSGYIKRSTSLVSWVELNPSYIYINETVGVGQVSNFSYIWGETPTQSGYKWAYIKHLNEDTGLWDTENTVSLSGTLKDTLYYSSSLIKKEGQYLIELCDLNFPCPIASQTFKSIYLPNTPLRGYQLSILNITSTKTIYSQGDLLQFDFQIDSSNFSNNTVTVEIYNNESKENYTLLTAQEDFEKHNYYLGQLYGSGLSQLRLVGTNSTNFRTVLSSRSLTISIIDNEGYGLEIDKIHPCKDEEITVTAISPVNSTITFSDRLSKTYNFTGTRTWRIIPDGDMTISLENNYGLQKKSGMINVNDNCNQINVETPNAGSSYGLGEDKTNMGFFTNLIILLGMPIFWGLVFIVGTIYYLRNNGNLILPILFIQINLEAVIGLLEPYTQYIVVVTWLVIAIFFIFVQRKATG